MLLKSIKILLVSLLLLIAMPITGFADEHDNNETTTDDSNEDLNELENEMEDEADENKTSDEVKDIDEKDSIVLRDVNGAHVRVLQLVKRMNHQIEDGNLIIDYLNENSDVDTTELESIIEDMESLLVEIREYNPEGKTADELAKKYTEVKAQAIELSQSFKELARGVLNDEQKEELRDIIQDRNDERLAQKDEKIENLRHEYNKKKAGEIAQRLGFNAQEIRVQMEEEGLSPHDVKEKILERFKSLDEGQKEKFAMELREKNQEIRIEAKAREDELRSNYKEKMSDLKMRLKERKDTFEMRIKEEGHDIRVKVEDDRMEFRDGRAIRVETRDDGRVKLEFRDNPRVALSEIERLIERKTMDVELMNERLNSGVLNELETKNTEQRIEVVNTQIKHLEEALSKIESHSGEFDRVKIEENSDGELEIEVELEDEDSKDESDVDESDESHDDEKSEDESHDDESENENRSDN